ncbi:hypothetical protein D9M72_295840 [compost metagenome]
MLAPQFGERRGGISVLCVDERRLAKLAANVDADGRDQKSEQERNTPAPGSQILRRHHLREKGAQGCSQQRSRALAHGLPADHAATTRHRSGFHHVCRGNADFAADGKTLQRPTDDDDDRRSRTDHCKRRAEGDGRRPDGHQDDGSRHCRAASDTVGIGTDHHRAKRPDEKANAKGAHCQQQRSQRIFRREELVSDHRREESEHGEVKRFQSTDERRCDDSLSEFAFDFLSVSFPHLQPSMLQFMAFPT